MPTNHIVTPNSNLVNLHSPARHPRPAERLKNGSTAASGGEVSKAHASDDDGYDVSSSLEFAGAFATVTLLAGTAIAIGLMWLVGKALLAVLG